MNLPWIFMPFSGCGRCTEINWVSLEWWVSQDHDRVTYCFKLLFISEIWWELRQTSPVVRDIHISELIAGRNLTWAAAMDTRSTVFLMIISHIMHYSSWKMHSISQCRLEVVGPMLANIGPTSKTLCMKSDVSMFRVVNFCTDIPKSWRQWDLLWISCKTYGLQLAQAIFNLPWASGRVPISIPVQ